LHKRSAGNGTGIDIAGGVCVVTEDRDGGGGREGGAVKEIMEDRGMGKKAMMM
jgi:hypothetical protein